MDAETAGGRLRWDVRVAALTNARASWSLAYVGAVAGMKFNSRAKLDTAQVSDRRGMSSGGKVAIGGGGIGALLLVVLTLLGGGNPADVFSTPHAESGQAVDNSDLGESCQTVADIEDNADCRFVVYVNSVQDFWEGQFSSGYQPAVATFFSGGVSTGCGQAPSSAGPFYCPADLGVYLDLSFFDDLRTTYGGSGGDFAEAYVLAHEYGHHVQNLTGQMRHIGRDSGPDSDAVRLELQADCYAGVWAHNATQTEDADGTTLITELTRDDIAEGLSAAEVVGDDYIQERFQGTVTPETWTHGSSEQRQRWFLVGYRSGSTQDCDTFSTDDL